jgi:hypothetical protein
MLRRWSNRHGPSTALQALLTCDLGAQHASSHAELLQTLHLKLAVNAAINPLTVRLDLCGIGVDLCGIGVDLCGIGVDLCGIGVDLCGIGVDLCDSLCCLWGPCLLVASGLSALCPWM